MTARSDVSSKAGLMHGVRALGRVLFGDRVGLVIFLGSLCVFGLYWRAGLFITDNRTLVQALAAVMDGRLWIDHVGQNTFAAPGAVRTGGLVYGRNYAQIAGAVPFLLALEVIETLADLHVGLIALWHLVLLGFVQQLGRLRDAGTIPVILGSGIVLASFVTNLTLATQFLAPSSELIALQLGSLCAGAFVGVLVYRLVATFHDRRLSAVAGLAAAIVLPIGFWAGIPKRHALSTLLLVGILYAFARSRAEPPETGRDVTTASRAGAYALVGLLAWLHAAEALFVIIPLVLVDVPTAPTNDRRTLAVVAVAFGLSLVPFFVTNLVIAGTPLKPPRTLPPADAAVAATADRLQATGTSAFEGIPGGFLLEGLVWLTSAVSNQVSASLAMVAEPTALYRTYIRSGSLEIAGSRGLPEFRAVNLSVLESVPLFGAAVAVLAPASRVRQAGRSVRDGVRPTDLLAVGLSISFLLLYTQRLPIHAQFTVRYLVPIYPVGLFLLVRLAPVRAVLIQRQRLAVWTYATAVLLGSQLVLAAVVVAGLTVAEAAQLHALLGLVAASVLAVSIAVTAFDDRAEPLAAVGFGLAAAAGTAFILLAGIAYFSFAGEYVLPVSGAISDLIGPI